MQAGANDAAEILPAELTARLRLLRLAARTRRQGTTRGDRRSPRHGTSLEFADYRSYAPGDDPRRVDWNQYARTGRLFTKVYEDEEDLQVHLLLDASSSMGFGTPSKLRAAAELAAALGYIALNEMDRVHLALLQSGSTRRFRPLRTARGALQLSDWLTGLAPQGQTDISAALHAYSAQGSAPGLAVLISDLLDPGGASAGLLALRSRGYDVVVVHLLSRDDLDPPLDGELEIVDSETRGVIAVSVDAAAVEAYRRRARRWVEEQKHLCRSLGAPYLQMTSGEAVEEVVFHRLRALRVLV